MLATRAHLFVFVTNSVERYTSGISERHLRPGLIFRNAMNWFRRVWGVETSAVFRAVVSTANANHASVLETIRFVLSAKRPAERVARGEQFRSLHHGAH